MGLERGKIVAKLIQGKIIDVEVFRFLLSLIPQGYGSSGFSN